MSSRLEYQLSWDKSVDLTSGMHCTRLTINSAARFCCITSWKFLLRNGTWGTLQLYPWLYPRAAINDLVQGALFALYSKISPSSTTPILRSAPILATIYPITALLLSRVNVFDSQSCNEDLRRIEAVAKTDVEGDALDQLETCLTDRRC